MHTLFLLFASLLVLTSVFTVVQAQPVAPPAGSLSSEADGSVIQGGNFFPPFDSQSATGTTSASVSRTFNDAVFVGSYQATAATDFGSNGARSRSFTSAQDIQGFQVFSRGVSRWTDEFVITGGSGIGTASVSVLLKGAILLSPLLSAPTFVNALAEAAGVAFSLDQQIEGVCGPGEAEGGSCPIINNVLFFDRTCDIFSPNVPIPECPNASLNFSEVLTGSFTFEYGQPFSLSGELTTQAVVFHASDAFADFLNTAKIILINLPPGATLSAGSGTYPVRVPFANLMARVEIETAEHEFEVKGTLTLGAGSNGIDPLTEDVSLQIGAFAATIPAGSFKRAGKHTFKFKGMVDGVALEVEIRARGGGRFEFKAEGDRANLAGTVNPVTVGIGIGNDGGSTAVTARFDN